MCVVILQHAILLIGSTRALRKFVWINPFYTSIIYSAVNVNGRVHLLLLPKIRSGLLEHCLVLFVLLRQTSLL